MEVHIDTSFRFKLKWNLHKKHTWMIYIYIYDEVEMSLSFSALFFKIKRININRS